MQKSGEEKLWEMIKDIHTAMMTTLDPDGQLRSRPMATNQVDFKGNLWFFTGKSTGKVDSIEAISSINLAYASPNKSQYVSICGDAEVIVDRAMIKKLWNPLLKAWFPLGEEDPEIVLLKVKVLGAEYWDAPSSKMVQLIGLVKAALTGKVYQPSEGEHQRL